MNLGLGLRLRSVLSSAGGEAGFGLPNSIIVSGAGAANGTYTKTSSAGVYTDAPIPATFNYLIGVGFFYITSPGNTNRNGDYDGNDWVLASGSDGVNIYSENASTDANNVPVSGWSPAITITAA